jgi:hypothetical protein
MSEMCEEELSPRDAKLYVPILMMAKLAEHGVLDLWSHIIGSNRVRYEQLQREEILFVCTELLEVINDAARQNLLDPAFTLPLSVSSSPIYIERYKLLAKLFGVSEAKAKSQFRRSDAAQRYETILQNFSISKVVRETIQHYEVKPEALWKIITKAGLKSERDKYVKRGVALTLKKREEALPREPVFAITEEEIRSSYENTIEDLVELYQDALNHGSDPRDFMELEDLQNVERHIGTPNALNEWHRECMENELDPKEEMGNMYEKWLKHQKYNK